MLSTNTIESMNYTRKHWSTYRLAQTRTATMANATEYCPINRPLRKVTLVALNDYELCEQREAFAERYHAHDCSCGFCTYEREMREEAYELEAEVGMAAHYEAMEMLEEEQRAREEASDEDFGLTEEDYNEFRERNVERGTAYGHWY